ncbi:hypothetical protein ACOMHN_066764 [Nucella lapillus]
MELGILHNSPPSTKRGCRAGRLHRLWHGLPPAPWPCTRSQHHSVPSRNLHPLMVPPFLQPHPDLQSAVGNAPLSSKHPAQLPTTNCLLSIISPMGGQPSDAPALSPPSPLQQGGQSSNAPALSPPSPLPQGGQPIALALSPPSPPPQGGQPSDAPGLSPSSSTLLLCPSDSTLNICHLNSQSAVKTGSYGTIVASVPESRTVTFEDSFLQLPEVALSIIGFRSHISEYPSHGHYPSRLSDVLAFKVNVTAATLDDFTFSVTQVDNDVVDPKEVFIRYMACDLVRNFIIDGEGKK